MASLFIFKEIKLVMPNLGYSNIHPPPQNAYGLSLSFYNLRTVTPPVIKTLYKNIKMTFIL